jgi:hypothetical protein
MVLKPRRGRGGAHLDKIKGGRIVVIHLPLVLNPQPNKLNHYITLLNMAIFRPSTWGNNNSEDGLDSRTIGIIVAVVSVLILSAMVLCVCVRRRRRVKS